jgi:hypothetical protein
MSSSRIAGRAASDEAASTVFAGADRGLSPPQFPVCHSELVKESLSYSGLSPTITACVGAILHCGLRNMFPSSKRIQGWVLSSPSHFTLLTSHFPVRRSLGEGGYLPLLHRRAFPIPNPKSKAERSTGCATRRDAVVAAIANPKPSRTRRRDVVFVAILPATFFISAVRVQRPHIANSDRECLTCGASDKPYCRSRCNDRPHHAGQYRSGSL